MAIFKRPGSPYYQYEFMFRGERIRESTKQTNATVAREMEAAHRTSLAKGEVGIKERAQAPKLSAFIAGPWADYIKTRHADKPRTVELYLRAAEYLLMGGLGDLRLDEITNQHTTRYFAYMRGEEYSVVATNIGLKSLRRILSLAVEFGMIEKKPALSLLKGETMREQILTREEQEKYLAACSGIWHTMALTMLSTGMRPGEVARLVWEGVSFEARTVRVFEGKTKNAPRSIPMRDRLYDALRKHWEAVGKPQTGLVFASKVKKAERKHYLRMHARAVKRAGLTYFVPYIFRHTALTELGMVCDPFTLMKIAGHYDISMTQRYIHPQAEAMAMAFGKLDGRTTPNPPHIVKSEAKRVA